MTLLSAISNPHNSNCGTLWRRKWDTFPVGPNLRFLMNIPNEIM
jgi:hypothetical protein